jgi:hypothetical protein
VDSEVKLLQEQVDGFAQQNARAPGSWEELISAGRLSRTPVDPKGKAYRLVSGRVQVADPDRFPFITRGLPPGQDAGDLPTEKGFKIVKGK